MSEEKTNNLNIEKGFISKLLQTKDMSTLKDEQIRASFFTGENKRAFNYIYKSVVNDREVPTVRVFKKNFPNFVLETVEDNGKAVVGTEESLHFWCEELRKKVKHNALAETIEKAAREIEDFDTNGAFDTIRKNLVYIESSVEVQTVCDITKNTADRKEAYLRRKENKGMQGLSYGIPHLDFITKGLKNSTLTTVIANTGVGKTWFEILIGAYLQLQNCRVLQCVTEMSEEIMRDRYEAMLFSMMYGDLNYNKFKSGLLSLSQEKQYFEFLENDLPECEPLLLVTATSPMKLSADIEKYKPDVIMIDGVYLMEDDQQAKDDWLRVTHITRDIKKIAKAVDRPILINTQADKNTSKKTGPGLDSIMYTQAIGQDSDEVFSLYRDDVMRSDNEMGLKVLKQREGMTGKVMMNWDFSSMNFAEIYAESQSGEALEDTTKTSEEKDKEETKNCIGVDDIE